MTAFGMGPVLGPTLTDAAIAAVAVTNVVIAAGAPSACAGPTSCPPTSG